MKRDAQLDPKSLRVPGANGVGIHVWDFGGEGPALILSHCTGTHGRIWDPMVPALLEHFRVYSVETRGHGESEQPKRKEDYAWSISGDDLLGVLDGLSLDSNVMAVGHSAGASHICYASWKRPNCFGRTVLVDPIIGPASGFRGENPLVALSRRRKNDFASRDEAIERYSSKPPMQSWDPDILKAYVEYGFRDTVDGRVTLKCPGQIEAVVYEGSGATDVFEHLDGLRMEVCLLTGEKSHISRLTEMQRERFRHVEYHVIEGAGHFIPQEKPREVTKFILGWLT